MQLMTEPVFYEKHSHKAKELTAVYNTHNPFEVL